jgi:hypothetical protein
MAEQTNNKCECEGAKRNKALEKQVKELKEIVERLFKEVKTLRKAVRK